MKETPFGCGESAWVSGRANNTGCAKVLRDAAAQLYCAESEWEGRKGAIMGSPAHLVHSLRESKVHCAESEWEGRKGAIMGSPAHLVHSLRESKVHCAESEWEGRKGAIMGSPAHLVHSLRESKVRAAHARRVELLRARRPHREQEVGGLEVAVDQLAAVHVRHGAHDALEHAGDTRLAAHPPPPPQPPTVAAAAVSLSRGCGSAGPSRWPEKHQPPPRHHSRGRARPLAAWGVVGTRCYAPPSLLDAFSCRAGAGADAGAGVGV
jgi:hypothetical protein